MQKIWQFAKKAVTFGTPLFAVQTRNSPKVRSHFGANNNLFSEKTRLYKHRRYFSAKKIANLKNL